jgi:hypothetical protein
MLKLDAPYKWPASESFLRRRVSSSPSLITRT